MSTAARDVLAAYNALSPAEQNQVAAEIVGRSLGSGQLSDDALTELAAELFRSYDAEEAKAR